MTATAEPTLDALSPPGPSGGRLLRWAPPAVTVAVVAAVLLAADTPAADLARYGLYALLAVLLPGTLVYRALRRRPHTLVEDLAVGAVVGLALELPAWFVFVAAGAERWLWLWPLAVVVPFLAVPGLRRHWRVTGYTPVPAWWSWSLAAVVAGFMAYLYVSFLRPNPLTPAGEQQAQYIDLAFQMSLAGEATHRAPLDLPQAAGEPLHYHWFGFAHMGAASLVSGVDLPTVFLRLAVPALCALAAVLVAVVGWRVSGRAGVGAVAAGLMFTIGEFGYENGIRQLFGTQVTFIVWGSPSMTYSWVLLLPLIAVLGETAGRLRGTPVPAIGRGVWPLATLFLLASTGAKASSVPVVAGALGITAAVLLVARRRVVWPVVAAGVLALAAQGLATAVLFAFESHGVTVDAFSGFAPYLPEPRRAWVGPVVFVAYLLNLHLRSAGILALLWHRRGRLAPVQVFLLGGALAGPAIYLVAAHPGGANQYFNRAALPFGVILSAWGFVEVLDRARLSRRAAVALGAAAAAFAVLVTVVQVQHPATVTSPEAYGSLLALLRWALLLGVAAAVAAVVWWVVTDRWPALRGRGPAALLTGVLVAGAPGLVTDAAAARTYPNGGAYAVVPMPLSRVSAARWVHDHSDPDDVLATNAHCREIVNGWCDARTFWLSGYSQRSVLIEGWAFAPRVVGDAAGPYVPFWDQGLFEANEAVFRSASAAGLAVLRQRGVRWLVVDRESGTEAPELATLTDLRYDNGRIAVYGLR